MNKTFILGLDIGSSSVRGALFDARGVMIKGTFVREESRLRASNRGGSEADSESIKKLVVSVIDKILEISADINGEIAYIASCTFWHSLIGIDDARKPTTPVYGWADTQSREYTQGLKKRFDEAVTHNRTGAHFHSSFWPAKLLWLRKEFPEVWKKTETWLSISDYLTLRFCGQPVTSISMASGTGIFDIRRCDWDAELLRYLKIKRTSLPKISMTDAETFSLLPKWKKRWPQLKNARFFPPVADGAANNIGSGCDTRERAALMIGTSGAMRVVYKGEPPAKIPTGLWCYRVDREHVIVGGALSDGGGLYDWLKRNLRIDLTDKQIESEIKRRMGQTNCLEFQPYLGGERSTGYREDAAGAIIGLRMSHDAIDILRAAMESVAERFADIFSRLETVSPVEKIVASGGALENSPIWREMIKKALGRELTPSAEKEASLRGSVLLALKTTGKI